MAKRPCLSDNSPRASKRNYDQFNTDVLLESLFAVSDSALIDASLNGLVESRSTDSDQNDFIQRVLHLGSVFLEAGNRCARKHSSVHNALVWPLSPDLTIKVFSLLDTPSVCSAAATCSFFQKCAIDPLCYVNIDLAGLNPEVNDAVVSTVIERAANALQSIKLGVLPPSSFRDFGDDLEFPWNDELARLGKMLPILSGSCLSSLNLNGYCLRRLHLYYIERMDTIALMESLSVFPSLVDLEIVCLHVDINDTLESVSGHCRLIKRFIYQSDLESDSMLQSLVCKEFVLNCPQITTLALKGCKLNDHSARVLVKGFHELKYLDFTDSYSFTGAFLKNLGTKGGGNSLEVLILRECNLDRVEVKKFMKALLAGKFGLLRHLDISKSSGSSLLPFLCEIFSSYLLKQRPNLCLVADFSKKMKSNTLDTVALMDLMLRYVFGKS
ncbi:hypothetical protein LXL04_018807 [Taraxacum kok-saghyz]